MIKIMKKHRKNEAPVLVHCSAGIGRTGTLIVIFSILESLEKFDEMKELIEKIDVSKEILDHYPYWNKPRISVFGAVRKIREQRWNMVKKPVQYSFIYDYLERWVRKTYFDK